MELVVFGVTCFLEIIRYYLVNILCWKIRPIRPQAYLAAVFPLAGMFFLSLEVAYFTMYVVVMVAGMFAYGEKTARKVFIFLSDFVLFTFTDCIVSVLIKYTIGVDAVPKEISTIVEMSVSVGILILGCLISKGISSGKIIKVFLDKYISEIIIGLIMVLGATIYLVAVENLDADGLGVTRKIALITLVALIALVILLVFVSYIKKMNYQMEAIIETERNLKLMQEKYYLMLLEKEENTRKYRHDMNYHYAYLEEYARKENAVKTLEYIHGLQENFKTVQKKEYVTGNNVLDLIFNNYLTEIKGVEVSVRGKCPKAISISDVDMCTIFSNLVKNAVEEMERLSGDKYIRVSISQGNMNTEVAIINSCLDNKIIENGVVYTSKDDKKNHGFGILNAKEAVGRNAGELEICAENGEFVARVRLKNKEDEKGGIGK